MRHREKRGGRRRPVSLLSSRFLAAAWGAATAGWLFALATVAHAHGGIPILQAGPERVNPGGTIELVGDMTQEGPVEILLVAPAAASVRPLDVVETDEEGHFRIHVTVPVDVATGSYVVRAVMAAEDASAPIEVTGAPSAGEAGQLPGQDEARAPVPLNSGVEPGGVAAPPVSEPVGGNGTLAFAAAGLLIALGGAILIGWLARSRGGAKPAA